MARGEACVLAGAGMTAFGRAEGRGLGDLAGEAARAALDDAGLAVEEVDCVFAANSVAGVVTGQEAIRGQVALKGIGIRGVPVFNVENACASGAAAIQLADAYLRSGGGRIALVVGYEKMVHPDKRVPLRALEACSDLGELEGLKAAADPEAANRSVFMDIYARKIRRYMAQTDARPVHLAMIAAKNHANGALNPKAQFRTPRSAEEVLAARTVVPPLTLFMCSPISDGAAAVVLVAADHARDRRLEGPVLAGCALAMDNLGDGRSQMVEVARTAYRRAGIGPEEVDLAEVHDATAAGELFALEDLGLAAPGTGWRQVEEGATRIDGMRPVNPSGGLLARGHPIGATGVAQVVELLWQMRGQAGPRQVARARVAVAHCAGGQAAFAPHNGAAAMAVSVLRAR